MVLMHFGISARFPLCLFAVTLNPGLDRPTPIQYASHFCLCSASNVATWGSLLGFLSNQGKGSGEHRRRPSTGPWVWAGGRAGFRWSRLSPQSQRGSGRRSLSRFAQRDAALSY